MKIKRLNLSGMILSALGVLDSAYLTFTKFTSSEVYCANIGDCNAVNNSPYAEIFGVPIALLGAGAYLLMLGLFWVEEKNEFWQEYTPIFLFILTLIGVIYSAYLTYVEIAILHKICIYCVFSAIFITLLFGLSIFKVVRYSRGQ